VTFADLVSRLETGLRGELPGPEAQDILSPIPRREWPSGHNPARIRNAAGLLLVFPKTATTINAEHAEFAEQLDQHGSLRVPRVLRSMSSAEAHIVLTVRADTLRHGGQISLPGGVVEPGETFEQAALREAHEEVALPPGAVRVLGPLTALDIPVSGFRLYPIVGVSAARPLLRPADGEVADILEVPVAALMAPQNFVLSSRERDGVSFAVPAFHVAGREIWGATAMVLAEFLTLLGWREEKPQ
jgi:8-oxo-dGTP pyrophosphatase MutT (NUDIX family)